MPPTLTMAWFALSLTLLVFVTRWFGLRVQSLVLRLTGNAEVALYVYFFLLLPGTLAHEFSHLLMAKVLGLRTGKLSVRPKQRTGRGAVVQFGGVQVQPGDPLRESLVGLAPLLIGSALVLWLARARLGLSPQDAWSLAELPARIGGAFERPDAWLWLYLAMAISNAMLPSASDRRGWRTVGTYGVLVLAVLYAAGVLTRIPSDVWGTVLRLVNALAFCFTLTLIFDGLIGGLFWALEALAGKIQKA